MRQGVCTSVTIDRRRLVQSLVTVPFLGYAGVVSARGQEPSRAVDLKAIWQRSLDPNDAGIADRWYARDFPDMLPLPGSLEQRGVGKPVTLDTPWTGDINDRSFFTAPEYARYRTPGAIKVPFFLQPDSWYRGAAWYQREIAVPSSWRGKHVELFLERPHWETRVWLGEQAIGRSDALHVPHRYNLGVLEPGKHRLTLRVDNRMIVEIGHNGHGITDHTQGNWNGIAGRIELRATEPVWFDRVTLDPMLGERTVRVRGELGRSGGAPPVDSAEIAIAGRISRARVAWSDDIGRFEAVVTFDASDTAALRTWDEFDPVLHEAVVRLGNGEEWRARFGWRELAATPVGFVLNGRPTMFRGALECSIFPLTGHPATDIDSWRHIMRRAREYGLNHLRFHSYCPPEAAFDAADEIGLYLQIETVWANQSVRIGSGLPVDRWIYAETDRILAEHGHHPSFMLMTHGNEPGGGDAAGEARRDTFLGEYVRHYRARDRQRLWTAGSGWPTIDENQFHVTPTPRIQNWGEGLKSRINAKPPETRTDYRDFIGQYRVPVISHEIGQWCVYPNLNETSRYTGYLKAKNFEIFADRLRENGLHDLAPEFLYASGRLQVLCYKEDIESALRTRGMGGFQLLGLQDFPGQGTALVGVVDPFWDDKGYVTAREYRRFCATTTPLARMAGRVVRSGERFPFTVDVAHFGPTQIDGATIEWTVMAGEDELAHGAFDARAIPLGNAPLGLAASPVLRAKRATAAKLTVAVRQDGRTLAENDWDLWVYPAATSARGSDDRLLRTKTINDAVLRHLEAGGDALIGLPAARVTNFEKQPVKLGFSSIFWNTLWTERQAPTTLGILCDPQHPALANFPTEPHSNWQWWYLLHRAGALRLDFLPPGVTPVVRVIDDWFTARPLGLVIEVAVGRGRAIVCGFEIGRTETDDPVSRQLVTSLEHYMESNDFRPAIAVTADQLRRLQAA